MCLMVMSDAQVKAHNARIADLYANPHICYQIAARLLDHTVGKFSPTEEGRALAKAEAIVEHLLESGFKCTARKKKKSGKI
jgi:hypothetical protein